jgi:hypothetical protein
MNAKLISFLKHYVFGLLTSSFNGATSAVAGILGIDAVALTGVDQVVNKGGDAVRLLNLHEMVSCFFGALILHAFMYFKSHPLPETLDTNPPIPPT